MTEKLQKVLAREGLASRREVERWIREGRISVNGKKATLGDRVEVTDKIRVDGRPVAVKAPEQQKTRVIMYHKPEGEVCTRSDPEGRPTVFERLPKMKSGRWINVGRLDINTSGLLLFTNDGELANQLMHPSSELEREYAVRVFGEVKLEIIKRLTQGVKLEDGIGRFNSVQKRGGTGLNQWYHVIIKEGRNREVRRLWESQGVTVSRLIRIRFGDVSLPKYLARGRWKELENFTMPSSTPNT